MKLQALIGALALVAIAACGDGTVEATAPATADPPPTTVAPDASPTTTAVPPAPTTTPPATAAPPAGNCSAAGMAAGLPAQELPAPVAATWRRIVDMAVTCDYDGLAALAGESPFFTFSFGGGDDPAAFWREAEAQGDPVIRRMVEVLHLPAGVQDEVDPPIYVWPEVATLADPTDADYDQVRGIYDEEAIELFEGFGGYIGYRAGIQADGAWLSFVAGD